MGFFPFTVLWVIYYIILCFLRHYFAAHPTTATLFSVVTRVSRSRRTRKFAQDSTVRAEYLVRAGLDGSRRTRRFAQDSTVRAGLDSSRRTRRFSQTELDGSRRTRPFWPLRRLIRAGLDGSRRTRPFWPLRRLIRERVAVIVRQPRKTRCRCVALGGVATITRPEAASDIMLNIIQEQYQIQKTYNYSHASTSEHKAQFCFGNKKRGFK